METEEPHGCVGFASTAYLVSYIPVRCLKNRKKRQAEHACGQNMHVGRTCTCTHRLKVATFVINPWGP